MTSSEVIKKLDLFYTIFDSNRKRYSILIDGKWGIGKSYTVNNFLKDKRNSQYSFSVFGIKNIENIEKTIIKKVLFPTFEKINKDNYAKTIGVFLNKLSAPIPSFKELIDIQNIEDLKFSKKSLVIIDDLERLSDSIDFKEILGLFERISSRTNLIIICNTEELLDRNKEIFNKFKEKIISTTFKITEISTDTLRLFLKGTIFKNNEQDLLFTLFRQVENENFRVLEKVETFFNELKLFFGNKPFFLENREIIIESIFHIILEDSTNYYTEKHTKLIQGSSKKPLTEIQEAVRDKGLSNFTFLPNQLMSLGKLIDKYYKTKKFDLNEMGNEIKNLKINERISNCKTGIDHLIFYSNKERSELFKEIELLLQENFTIPYIELLMLYGGLLKLHKESGKIISSITTDAFKEKIKNVYEKSDVYFDENFLLRISDNAIKEELKILVLEIMEDKMINEENIIKLLKTNNYDEIIKLWQSNYSLKLTEALTTYFLNFLNDGIEVEYHYMICRIYTMLSDKSKIKINKIIDDKNITDNYIIKRVEIMRQYI